jgi:hypothetical protein
MEDIMALIQRIHEDTHWFSPTRNRTGPGVEPNEGRARHAHRSDASHAARSDGLAGGIRGAWSHWPGLLISSPARISTGAVGQPLNLCAKRVNAEGIVAMRDPAMDGQTA